MADKPAKCPKCNGSMEEGRPQLFGWVPVTWEAPWFAHFRAAFRPTDVRGLRCKECGYLEFYTKP
jgi:DNA-directed RNA polymerase subunit RPC12/RpoP